MLQAMACSGPSPASLLISRRPSYCHRSNIDKADPGIQLRDKVRDETGTAECVPGSISNTEHLPARDTSHLDQSLLPCAAPPPKLPGTSRGAPTMRGCNH